MSWIIYFTINIICGFLDVVKVRPQRLLLFIASINIIIFIGFRYKLGVDWAVYEDLFVGRVVYVPFEYGYVLLNNLFSFMGIGFWAWVFFITLFSLYTFIRFYKEFSPTYVFCLTFYFILSFAFNIEALRQIIAVAITLWAAIYYMNDKKIKSLIFVICASFMHVSALFLLLIPLIDNKIFRNMALPTIFIGAILAALSVYPIDVLINIVSSYISNPYIYKIKIYTLGSNVSSILTLNLVFKLIILAFLYINRKSIIQNSKVKISNNVFNTIVSLFYLMLVVDIFLGKYGSIRLRLDEYLNPYFILILSFIIIYAKNKVYSQLMIVVIICYSLSNILKFSQNDYFIKQFRYSNSLVNYFNPDHSHDLKREREVIAHWLERDKIIIDE
ncbi:EpsG family protein [Pseudocitrobacter faecalis]|uniref:EpsG family protein n=1 Tax=Pseudocitrobacter faecalis TaxID=1398493 RepID=UPI003B9DD416